ncbi:hypothetical protein D9Q98_002617 [Chlorella vulgaris]|uniref:Uncharacterized protein n=1 Tax=Chlorella vulgaris TaxID=3077 RepID=A0A9D4YZG3_CHLVU|nr:hypothetical protein D9Q98_002617 [Chlorella vulgaris]
MAAIAGRAGCRGQSGASQGQQPAAAVGWVSQRIDCLAHTIFQLAPEPKAMQLAPLFQPVQFDVTAQDVVFWIRGATVPGNLDGTFICNGAPHKRRKHR